MQIFEKMQFAKMQTICRNAKNLPRTAKNLQRNAK